MQIEIGKDLSTITSNIYWFNTTDTQKLIFFTACGLPFAPFGLCIIQNKSSCQKLRSFCMKHMAW